MEEATLPYGARDPSTDDGAKAKATECNLPRCPYGTVDYSEGPDPSSTAVLRENCSRIRSLSRGCRLVPVLAVSAVRLCASFHDRDPDSLHVETYFGACRE